MRDTYFRTVVQGATLEEVKTAAEKAIKDFFGKDLPFAIDIDPDPTRQAPYQAHVHCRGFEV